MNQFIKELQALEESTKRKILVGGTILAMGVVMYLWVGYFGSLITTAPQGQSAVAQNAPSIWDNMKSGMANMYDTIKGPQQYEVKPANTN